MYSFPLWFRIRILRFPCSGKQFGFCPKPRRYRSLGIIFFCSVGRIIGVIIVKSHQMSCLVDEGIEIIGNRRRTWIERTSGSKDVSFYLLGKIIRGIFPCGAIGSIVDFISRNDASFFKHGLSGKGRIQWLHARPNPQGKGVLFLFQVSLL